jgi:hypothetical protein
MSNEDDVRAQLESNHFVKRKTIQRSLGTYAGTEELLVSFTWRSNLGALNRLYLRENKVLRIAVVPDYKLTLGEVVKKYGPPEYVRAFIAGEGPFGYSVFLEYPARGLGFTSYTHNIDEDDYIIDTSRMLGVLPDSLLVTEVDYFSPTSLENMLGEVFSYSPDSVEYHVAQSREWKGFGSVELGDW